MSRPRSLALAVLVAALLAYGAAAGHLPALPSGFDVAFQCAVVFPASTAAIWLALPLARRQGVALLVAAAVCGALAAGLGLAGLGWASDVSKLAAFALLGFWALSLFDDLWWVAAVSVVIPWVDIWSVATGPTRYVVEQRPGIFEHVAVGFPSPGGGAVELGPPDVIFFSLFLATAARFGLRVAWTWIAMTGLLSVTLALVWKLELSGLPALPAIALGFLVPNADRIWLDVRAARAAARPRG